MWIGEDGKVREYEGWEGEREEFGAEGDGRRGGGKGDGEEVLHVHVHTYTHCFYNTCKCTSTCIQYIQCTTKSMCGGQCLSSDKSLTAIASMALVLPTLLKTCYMCDKYISDVETIVYDQVEETMGYEHKVEVMSALLEAMRHEKPEVLP